MVIVKAEVQNSFDWLSLNFSQILQQVSRLLEVLKLLFWIKNKFKNITY